MKNWIQLVILLGMLNTTAPSTLACSCGQAKVKTTKKALRSWFDTFDGAIFVGTVEIIESGEYLVDADRRLITTVGKQKVVFRVERFWKGVQGSTATIYTGAGCCDCGVGYKLGQRYFISAFRIENRLETSICTSQELNAVKSFEKNFGKGYQPRPETP